MAHGGRPTALDFFAGAGLATEGLRGQFKVRWANDICPKKAATYNANHVSSAYEPLDVAEIHGEGVPSAILSWASFPCQDLSLAGRQRGIDSPRSGLVWHWLRIMDEMGSRRPPILVAENVVGWLSSAGGEHYVAFHEALAGQGYQLGAVVLDAARWLPQSRPRVFVVAVKKGVGTTHLESHEPLWCHPTAVTRVAERLPGFVFWSLPKPRPRKLQLVDLIDFTAEPHPPDRSQANLDLIPQRHRDRLSSSINGDRAVFPGYKRTRNGKQVLELRFDNIAGCLRTPEGGSSRQTLVVYQKGECSTRLLTVRETARLMGARDSYRIVGSYNDGYKAMGDAVAVPAVRHLARHLLRPLAEEAGRD